ncbi:nucleoside/nucleotide kinase family protein [Alphaproteobacteria bacterium]|nr:nucleoside/nucleotide kinase family protein [Alphaproteobacteria bacterium]
MLEKITSADELARQLLARKTDARMIIAIIGPPGSGKSTLVQSLKLTIDETYAGGCEIVPMDGFHYDNAILDDMGLRPRKGAPQTFDIGGLGATLSRLHTSPYCDVAVPVFDRSNDCAYASARMIPAASQIILVEGNYLLLDDPQWRALDALFDLSVEIRCAFETLELRLLRRWLDLGYSETAAQAKLDDNDLPNCKLVMNHSRPADITFWSEG